ncbi:GntR family transcriptional regulator [bacterium]|nr:MAG: GntR family transcriptional regulator [bacterium]
MPKNSFTSAKSPTSSSSGARNNSAATPKVARAGASAGSVAPLPATTRWKEIADSVQSDIEEGRLSVGDLLPSETVLTEQWKVSRMTAHRAMQELQRSGLVTRQRGRGTLVAGNNARVTGNVALLFHNPLDQLEIEYMRGINIGLSDDYQLIFCDSHADPDREARYLQRMHKEVDGIICMPSGHPESRPILCKMLDSGYPIVCVDRFPTGMELDAVVSDNFGASVDALRGLVARGHRRIAHFTENDLHVSAVRERYDAFIHVSREAGVVNPERLVRFFPAGAEDSHDAMVQMMHDALFTLRHQSAPPTALFCLNDYCLTFLLEAAERLEIRIPQDMEILTFHDALTLMPSVSSCLHRIVQEPRKMGQLAAERLKRRMSEGALPSEVVRVKPTIYSLQSDFPDSMRQSLLPDVAKIRQSESLAV